MHDFGPWEEARVTGDPQKHRVMRGDRKWIEKVNDCKAMGGTSGKIFINTNKVFGKTFQYCWKFPLFIDSFLGRRRISGDLGL